MYKGLYLGAMGMLVQEAKQDTIANNLANVSTTGFKKKTPVFRSFPEIMESRIYDQKTIIPQDFIIDRISEPPKFYLKERPLVGGLGTGIILDETATLFEEGPIRPTNNPLDFAITGNGFFSIQTKEGEFYTRNGSFTLNRDNLLVTLNGDMVLGRRGPIKITGHEFVVTRDGRVLENTEADPNGWKTPQEVDQLKIVDFKEKRWLSLRGDSFFEPNEASGRPELASNYQVHQGMLEGSNVNPVVEMVGMIEAMRAYEANQRVIQSHDQLIGRAVNEVGAR